MKRADPRKKPRSKTKPTASAKHATVGSIRRASIFRNGSNQAVRLPQDMRFPHEVKEVRIRKQGDGLLISPVRPGWASFFALKVSVPDDFLNDREDATPQQRNPL
jgi:antitoxin VapB